MNTIFNYCVEILSRLADALGTSYEKINVIIFCVIGPISFAANLFYSLHLQKKVKELKSIIHSKNNIN